MNIDTPKSLLALAATEPVVLAEYRSGGTAEETIKWRDKQTGQAQTATVRNFNFEIGAMLCRVQLPRDLEKGASLGMTDGLDLTRGKVYLVRVKSCQMNRGVLAVSGTIHPFSAEAPSKT